jgi:hypothetical protein
VFYKQVKGNQKHNYVALLAPAFANASKERSEFVPLTRKERTMFNFG